MRSNILVLLPALALFGCEGGGDTTSSSGTSGTSGTGIAREPKPSDYASDCQRPSDCVAVYFGADACCGGCTSDAIAAKDKARYDEDWKRFRSTCGSLAPCAPSTCQTLIAACTMGRCTLVAPDGG